MKKFSKAILIALLALLVLALVGLFGLNLFIQSPGVQARIQEEISRALHLPLAITNTTLTPWSDLRIRGISIPDGSGSNLLEASSFSARYRLLPLLRGKLLIEGMSVENPTILWPQNAEGKWVLPQLPPAAASPQASSAPDTAKNDKKSGLEVVIAGFLIKHGTVTLLDHARKPLATFTDVEMNYTTLQPDHVAGVATIGRAVWSEAVALDRFHTSFDYAADILHLPDFAAQLGGGPLDGAFELKASEPKSPFSVRLKFAEADVARLSTESHWPIGQISGWLSGTLDLTGLSGGVDRGKTVLNLRNGRFRDLSYLEMIGQALQIAQLSDLRIKQAHAEARLTDDRFFVDTLALDASDLELDIKGGVARYDGKLDLPAHLITSGEIFRQLPRLVSDNFARGPEDTRFIDFRIYGQASKPKTDLLDRVIGQKLETQFNDLVNGLFGGKKKVEDKKPEHKKKDEPASGAPGSLPPRQP